jgi:hypothetical protein
LVEQRHQYGRSAILGDRTWQEGATRLAGPFLGRELEFFELDGPGVAWASVNE